MRSLPGDARSSPRDTRRDHRLDFWRGLCLIDMVLVHLVYANLQFGDTLHDWIANYTRFAAGGFIFIAGLSIGKIYLPRVFDPCRRRATHFSLLRRSIYVLLVQYISTFGFIIVDSLRGQTAPFAFWPMVRDILMLREGGDLLPFYVMMIALSPIILEALRYRFAWIGVAALSIALFVWGQWHPFFLAIAAQQYFPPILWQVIFIGGVLAGAALPKYDALPKRAKMLALLIVVAIFAVLFDSEFSSCFGLPPLDLHLTFSKVPLSGGEVLRYFSLTLAIFMSTDLLWPVLKRWPGVGFVKTLGRKSLPSRASRYCGCSRRFWNCWRISHREGGLYLLLGLGAVSANLLNLSLARCNDDGMRLAEIVSQNC
jgi:hypothetical protein